MMDSLASFRIVASEIDVDAVASEVRSPQFGAVVTFAGTVRESAENGRAVTALTYEAYETMARTEFAAIAREAEQRFGPCKVSIVHRTGVVNVGDTSVVVAAAAPHRAQAFDACEYVIDQVKHRAPVWKREAYAGGASQWKRS